MQTDKQTVTGEGSVLRGKYGVSDSHSIKRKPVTAPRTVAGEWATAKQLMALNPKFYDLNTFAITEDGSTWHFCGTDKWFRTSGN